MSRPKVMPSPMPEMAGNAKKMAALQAANVKPMAPQTQPMSTQSGLRTGMASMPAVPAAVASLAGTQALPKPGLLNKPTAMKKGGSVKSSASKRADGCATKGKTKGKIY